MIRLLQGLGSNHYVLNWAPGAGQRRTNRIANAEHEGRLPRGIAREFGELGRGLRFLVPQPLMIDEFHGFVDWSTRDSTAGEQKMRSLPYPPRAKALFLIIPIAHSDEAENERGSQQICVGIPIATGRELYQ